MKKIILCISAILVLVACEDRRVVTSRVDRYVVWNQTDEHLSVAMPVGGWFYSSGNDMFEAADTLYGAWIFSFGAYGEEMIAPRIPSSYSIYSMCDTTSYVFDYRDDKENLLKPYIVEEQESIDSNNSIVTTTLTLTDEALVLLQKDYSMLEQFPEQYQ